MKIAIYGVAALAALALSGCGGLSSLVSPSTLTSGAAVAEKADTEASLLYVGIATSLNAYEGLSTTTAAQKVQAEAVKKKAWADLQTERAAYAAGQVVTTVALVADQSLASALTGAAVAKPTTPATPSLAAATASTLAPSN